MIERKIMLFSKVIHITNTFFLKLNISKVMTNMFQNLIRRVAKFEVLEIFVIALSTHSLICIQSINKVMASS